MATFSDTMSVITHLGDLRPIIRQRLMEHGFTSDEASQMAEQKWVQDIARDTQSGKPVPQAMKDMGPKDIQGFREKSAAAQVSLPDYLQSEFKGVPFKGEARFESSLGTGALGSALAGLPPATSAPPAASPFTQAAQQPPPTPGVGLEPPKSSVFGLGGTLGGAAAPRPFEQTPESWMFGGNPTPTDKFGNISTRYIPRLQADLGLTRAQAEGVMGSFGAETTGFQDYQERNPRSGRGGIGWAQWTGSRRNDFENFAKQRGLDPRSDEASYQNFLHEATTSPLWMKEMDRVRGTTTADEAAKTFSGWSKNGRGEGYLRPGVPHNAESVRYTNIAGGLGIPQLGRTPEMQTSLPPGEQGVTPFNPPAAPPAMASPVPITALLGRGQLPAAPPGQTPSLGPPAAPPPPAVASMPPPASAPMPMPTPNPLRTMPQQIARAIPPQQFGTSGAPTQLNPSAPQQTLRPIPPQQTINAQGLPPMPGQNPLGPGRFAPPLPPIPQVNPRRDLIPNATGSMPQLPTPSYIRAPAYGQAQFNPMQAMGAVGPRPPMPFASGAAQINAPRVPPMLAPLLGRSPLPAPQIMSPIPPGSLARSPSQLQQMHGVTPMMGGTNIPGQPLPGGRAGSPMGGFMMGPANPASRIGMTPGGTPTIGGRTSAALSLSQGKQPTPSMGLQAVAAGKTAVANVLVAQLDAAMHAQEATHGDVYANRAFVHQNIPAPKYSYAQMPKRPIFPTSFRPPGY